jgi:acetoin utilization protein AcuC
MRPVRLRYTYELLRGYDAFENEDALLFSPRAAAEEELRWLHTSEYIAAVRNLSAGEGLREAHRFNFGLQGDNPYYPGMYDAATLSSGATLLAAEMVAEKTVDVAFNISGGLHHAAAGHASGFCVFNDPALAVHYFLRRGMRVAYIDIDAHHGDGVQEAFFDDDRVLTISVHESGRYLFPGTGFVGELGEGRGRGFSVNLPLFPYTSDDVYLDAFRQVVPPLVRAFSPDVVVTQLGIDSYHSDPLTHLQLTTMGFVELVREFAALGLPWLAMGGGGYDLMAVARAWTLAYGVMLGEEWPDRVPPAFSEESGLSRLRDTMETEVPPEVRAEARQLAEESVAAIKRDVFPVHSMGG